MRSTLLTLLWITFSTVAYGQGRLLFVIGSDTGIWTGLDVNDYHCTISGALYTDPAGNAARVMDPGFRSPLTDRYGTPMKLTWWMMAGNMFRLSVNTDVPVPSTMPVYLMKRFHGSLLRGHGDELTFHFHDWVWTDYDGDGKWYWNQANTYGEFVQDFDQTLAELLLEEDLFPVSFRSGWHAMNNEWQQRLDKLLPYSMHNDWPAVHTDTVEPLDNTYDWSISPSVFVPFHPSTTDYRVPGDGRGWNVRSKYLASADSAFVAKLFSEAAKGTDQVVCLWAHLPETDFPDNLVKVNRAIHAAAANYPTIEYRYCTAVEAMQRWRRTNDSTAPVITVQEISEGADVRWRIVCDEPIFQPEPFVAVKDKYETYRILPLEPSGTLAWTTSTGVPRSDIAKMGVAVTDTSGNHRTTFLRYLPDDVFVDGGESGYQELTGAWSTTAGTGFGASIRTAAIQPGDSASVRWTFTPPAPGLYSISLRVPAVSNPAGQGRIQWGTIGLDTNVAYFSAPLVTEAWVHIGILTAPSSESYSLSLTGFGGPTGTKVLAADALKISALVRDRWLESPEAFDAGLLVIDEENQRLVRLRNSGILPVTVSSGYLVSGAATLPGTFPLTIPAMGSVDLPLVFTPAVAGTLVDTLVIATDDPRHPVCRTVIHAMVREYFRITDNGDISGYLETGTWAFSSAGGYNSSSRYAYPAANVSATFTTRLKKAGVYEISEIVPVTVNASVRARYTLMVGQASIDSVFVDQNQGSGVWVPLWVRQLPADTTLTIRITDAMNPVVSGKVLRADAIQWQWLNDGATAVTGDDPLDPEETRLLQNYPNPFNATTRIRYSVGVVSREGLVAARVRLVVYDMLGREVAVLVDEKKLPGRYDVAFDGSRLSSGVYLYRLIAGDHLESRRLVLIK